MKINYLELNNIGPYVGKHIFDLDTNSSKNVILIGGKNGAGKTTFLKAIKYGLFGSFAMGLKTDTDRYLYEIKSLINNKATSDFYVKISFDYIENFETKTYVITRRWNYVSNELSENVTITANDIVLNDLDSKEISDKLRAMTSPQLINSFIFDGEKISAIIENGEISSYLEETFNSIFSIDLISQTQKDLESYLAKKADESQAKDQIENISLIAKINSLKNTIKVVENDLVSEKNALSNLLSMKKSNTDNFYKLGGLTKSQQELYMKRLDAFNKEKDEMNAKIKSYVESELPIYMNLELLKKAIEQCKKERYAKYPGFISEIESYLNVDLSDLKTKLNDKVECCSIIHDISEDSVKFIENRYNDTINKTNIVKPYINSKIVKTDEYKLLKKNLIDNENIETINRLMDENRKIDSSIVELEMTIRDNEHKLEALRNELNLTYSIYERLSDELKKSSLYDSSFIMGKSAFELCEKFAEAIKHSKLKKISDTALQIFNDTIRKSDFITDLIITKDFDLKLKNAKGTKINPKTLSAGEMQILISSLIWAMFRISGRREMFIFDTPLARLDTENRFNFITKIISTISSQVVILSTDSEFVGSNLDAINPVVLKKYLLEYNVSENATNVTDSYFGGAN